MWVPQIKIEELNMLIPTLPMKRITINLALAHASDEQEMKALSALTSTKASSQNQQDSSTLLNKEKGAEFLGEVLVTLDHLVAKGRLTRLQLRGRHSKDLFRKSELQSFSDYKIDHTYRNPGYIYQVTQFCPEHENCIQGLSFTVEDGVALMHCKADSYYGVRLSSCGLIGYRHIRANLNDNGTMAIFMHLLPALGTMIGADTWPHSCNGNGCNPAILEGINVGDFSRGKPIALKVRIFSYAHLNGCLGEKTKISSIGLVLFIVQTADYKEDKNENGNYEWYE